MTDARDPVVGLGDEAVGDLALVLRFDEELDLVAFFHDLPRDVGDQAIERDEQDLLFVQCQLQRISELRRRYEKSRSFAMRGCGPTPSISATPRGAALRHRRAGRRRREDPRGVRACHGRLTATFPFTR